ncbi:glycosyl hydrolase family 18 protein [Isoptericola rhizosphaerae]|uniref:glycosyl hydrolase family 18 protein n=1 Tax=Isoptericola rhizosphaerae TaxID=3377837 RepID=UPI00383BD8B4
MKQRTSVLTTLTATVAAAGLTAAALAAPAAAAKPAPAPPDASSTHDADGVNGYTTLGYFPAWGTGDTHDYEVADLVKTGAVADLTHLTYAFGNVTSDLVCDISDDVVPDDGVDPGQPEGDPENDYLRIVGAEDAVDGVADVEGQALAGNFNQLRKLKELYPDLKIMVSLGGWTWSDNFSEAASTAESRARLVESCLDVYLDGNLPVVGDQGGEGVAAGIFDGFDIDWEWPAATGEHPSPNPEADRENFLALMELFRAELDERSAADGEDYLLTGFAPAGWAPRTDGGWVDPRLAAVVDFLNIQGYDYHGTWVADRTGHQGNLHPYSWPDAPDQDANWGLAADSLLGAYRAAGYRDEQIVLGLAAYGQGWEGVDDPTPGAQAAGALGVKNYSELRTVGEENYDEEAVAAYRWDGDQWWSLDTPRSVTAKAEWLAENGFGGAYFWDIAGDYRNELGGALADTFRAAAPGPLVVGDGAAPWYASGVYTSGDVVSHDGVEYEAKWWTRGKMPGAAAKASKGPWVEVGVHGDHPVAAEECGEAFDPAATYASGDVVSRAGVNHAALWWTRGEVPGTSVTGAWDAGAPCV